MGIVFYPKITFLWLLSWPNASKTVLFVFLAIRVMLNRRTALIAHLVKTGLVQRTLFLVDNSTTFDDCLEALTTTTQNL